MWTPLFALMHTRNSCTRTSAFIYRKREIPALDGTVIYLKSCVHKTIEILKQDYTLSQPSIKVAISMIWLRATIPAWKRTVWFASKTPWVSLHLLAFSFRLKLCFSPLPHSSKYHKDIQTIILLITMFSLSEDKFFPLSHHTPASWGAHILLLPLQLPSLRSWTVSGLLVDFWQPTLPANHCGYSCPPQHTLKCLWQDLLEKSACLPAVWLGGKGVSVISQVMWDLFVDGERGLRRAMNMRKWYILLINSFLSWSSVQFSDSSLCSILMSSPPVPIDALKLCFLVLTTLFPGRAEGVAYRVQVSWFNLTYGEPGCWK